MKRRDDLEDELLRTVPLPRLVAAAAHMLRNRAGTKESDIPAIHIPADVLADFVDSLNVEELEELRRLALLMRDPQVTVH
jgi:hypothetical protein